MGESGSAGLEPEVQERTQTCALAQLDWSVASLGLKVWRGVLRCRTD